MRAPVRKSIIEVIKTDLFVCINIRPLVLCPEVFDELSLHLEEVVKRVNIVIYIFLAEVRMEGLESEVFEDLLALCSEETTDFLNPRLL